MSGNAAMIGGFLAEQLFLGLRNHLRRHPASPVLRFDDGKLGAARQDGRMGRLLKHEFQAVRDEVLQCPALKRRPGLSLEEKVVRQFNGGSHISMLAGCSFAASQYPPARPLSGLLNKHPGLKAKAGAELPGVIRGDRALAAEDHRAELAGAAKQPGEIGAPHAIFREMMLEQLDRWDVAPFHVRPLPGLEQGGQKVEIIGLPGSHFRFEAGEHLRDLERIPVFRLVMDGPRKMQAAERFVIAREIGETELGFAAVGLGIFNNSFLQLCFEFSA